VDLLHVAVGPVDFPDPVHGIEWLSGQEMSGNRPGVRFDAITRRDATDDELAIGEVANIEVDRDVGLADVPKPPGTLVAGVEGAVFVHFFHGFRSAPQLELASEAIRSRRTHWGRQTESSEPLNSHPSAASPSR
jgi:hypothetical protein